VAWGGETGACYAAREASTEAARRIASEWPLRATGDPVSSYMQQLGGSLREGLDGAGRKRWRFDVARNLAPSAFAAGDGYVVLTDGLVAFVRDESQLAAVLAHEMAHVLLGHFCRPRRPGGRDYQVGTLVQHYDAAAEEEADIKAVQMLQRAGFDPGAMASLLRCLADSTPSFRNQLNRRVQALERQGFARPVTAPRRDSPGFREARRLVEEDFKGLESAFDIENAWKRCQ
jgi:beta-barrel assembly-enhancing protease